MVVALFPGTFDPITNGHEEILRRGARLFDRVIVAVGSRIHKDPLFPAEERVAHVRQVASGLGNVEVASFTGLIVDFARERGATVLLRGIRDAADYAYETTMATTNRRLAPGLETVFLPASAETGFISSTLVKEVIAAGGAVDEFVPEVVVAALRRKRR